MILAVVGLQGSGKSTATGILREEGFHVIEIGDIWRELVKKAGIPMEDTRATREFTLKLRETHGKDIYARYVCNRIKKSMRNVVVMGVRSTYEMDYLKKNLKGIKVIAIKSPLTLRFERMSSRGKPEDPKTMADFMWLERRNRRGFMSDKKEEKHGLTVLIKNADYVVRNTGTEAVFRANLDKALAKARETVL